MSTQTLTTWMALCQQEITLLNEIQSILEEEQQLLIKRLAIDLPEITEKKLALLNRLQEQSKKRLAFLDTLHLNTTETLMSWLTGKPQAQTAWKRLQKITQELHYTNQQNGALLNEQMTSIDDMIHTLQTVLDKNTAYNKEGAKNTVRGRQRIIGSA